MSTTSITKVEANRRNALRSTGPTSEAGKAVVSANATRHGLLSGRPVLPGLEDPAAWDEHLARTLASLRPVGHLETQLAERVALLLWRLGRVARYERDTVAGAVDGAERAWARAQDPTWREGWPTPLEKAADACAGPRAEVELLEAVATLPPDERIDRAVAARLVDAAAKAAGVNIYDHDDEEPDVELPDYPDGADLDEVPWTAGQFLKTVAVIAKGSDGGRTGVALLAELAAERRRPLEQAERKRGELAASLDLFRRRVLLPDGPTLDRVSRYEAGLERSFYKALHELQRLQAARQGQAVPPPAAVDVSIDMDVSGGGVSE